MDNAYNPIKTVDGAAIYCPSSYQYVLEDVSAADAGRTEDALMHKNRIRQVVALELSWQNIPTATVSSLLQTFDPEYLSVNYLDAKAGQYITKTFYVGNRTAPCYNTRLGLWSNLSFKLIER